MIALTLAAALAAFAAAQDTEQPPVEPAPPWCLDSKCGPQADGVLTYWAADGMGGPREPGSEQVRAAQKRYNAWAKGWKGDRHGDERAPGFTLVARARGTLRGDRLAAPRAVKTDGRMRPETLLIPVYVDGAKLLGLWATWRWNCRRTEAAHDKTLKACKVGLDEQGGPVPHEPSVADQEKTLRQGYAALKDYELKAGAFDAFAKNGTLEYANIPRSSLEELARRQEKAEWALESLWRLQLLQAAAKEPY